MGRSLAERTRLRLVPQPPFDPVRRYGPNEIAHPFVVSELVVRDSAGNVVKRLVACPGGFKEVQP